MTSELRPAVAVAEDCHWEYEFKSEEEAAAVIEADREAVRAEIAAEVADYLKEGETIAECIARNRADANVLLEMFAAERVKVENYAKTMKIISDIANREAAELAKYKALAETLAGALESMQWYGCPVCNGDCAGANPPVLSCPMQQCTKALTSYKEQRDAS